MHDLLQHLMRYAREETFKLDTHCGSRAQNLLLLPPALYMGHFLLDLKSGQQRQAQERILQQFLALPASAWPSALSHADGLGYMLLLSLFLHSPAEWRQSRMAFVRRAIVYADLHYKLAGPLAQPAEAAAGAAAAAASAEPDKYALAKPALLLVALVDQLQSATKPAADESTWLATHKQRLQDSDQSLAAQLRGEVLSAFEDELAPSASFDELFDVMGTGLLVCRCSAICRFSCLCIMLMCLTYRLTERCIERGKLR